jgi:hypothetical protein
MATPFDMRLRRCDREPAGTIISTILMGTKRAAAPF